MTTLAIIGGTGLTTMEDFSVAREERVDTPYGAPSAPLIYGKLGNTDLVFLARHGATHNIPPHKINYRANIWALKDRGIQNVIAAAAVGAIRKEYEPGQLVIPDQIIDYTYARSHTFFEDNLAQVMHVDFTQPYCPELREVVITACRAADVGAHERATYAATQGPRLETAAEIDRLERDGCDIVGMTGMPETALARELRLCYVACAVVANPAAGRGPGPIEMDEIEANLLPGIERFHRLLRQVLKMLR